MRATEKCDVYSYGVVALEIMMGKHPGEMLESLSASRKALSRNAELLLKDVLDQRLPHPKGEVEGAVMLVVTIALACTRNTPELRPTMRYVAQELSARTRSCLISPLTCSPSASLLV